MEPLRLQIAGLVQPSRQAITLRGLASEPQSAQVLLRYAEGGRLLPAAFQPTGVTIGFSPANPADYRLQFAIPAGELPARTWLEITLDGILHTHGPLLVTT